MPCILFLRSCYEFFQGHALSSLVHCTFRMVDERIAIGRFAVLAAEDDLYPKRAVQEFRKCRAVAGFGMLNGRVILESIPFNECPDLSYPCAVFMPGCDPIIYLGYIDAVKLATVFAYGIAIIL